MSLKALVRLAAADTVTSPAMAMLANPARRQAARLRFRDERAMGRVPKRYERAKYTLGYNVGFGPGMRPFDAAQPSCLDQSGSQRRARVVLRQPPGIFDEISIYRL